VPEMGDRPQAIINKQLVESCDVLIGAFWTRIGTHTGVAESGTVEEIEEFIKAGKPVLLYFSSAPVVLESVDQDQYRRLTEFRKNVEGRGLVQRYEAVADLREKLARHLTATARRLASRDNLQNPVVELPPRNDRPEELRSRIALAHRQLETVLFRRERDWVTERDAAPRRLDNSKGILRSFASEILDFVGLLQDTGNDHAVRSLDGAVRAAKTLQDHELFIDGGASYRQFWEEGDRIFALVKSALASLAGGTSRLSRAQLIAAMQRQAHAGQLIISNVGDSPARALDILVDAKTPGEHQLVRAPDRRIETIGPGATVEFHITTFDGMPSTYHVALRWEDPFGVPGRWESDLTLRW
jgi:hypothetical protein